MKEQIEVLITDLEDKCVAIDHAEDLSHDECIRGNGKRLAMEYVINKLKEILSQH